MTNVNWFKTIYLQRNIEVKLQSLALGLYLPKLRELYSAN